jgi:perosamine synthetase
MIYLARPNLSGKEWEYVKQCLDTNWISSSGDFIPQFENKIAEYTGVKYAVAMSSGTAALHIALHTLGIGKNDAVIVPSLTFVASVNAVCYTQASPIFIDVCPDTWQLDTALLENYLHTHTYTHEGYFYDKKTHKCLKAILPVHVLGNMPDMHKIQQLAEKFNLIIIEDAAEALGSFYKNQHAGSLGRIGILSFNGNKVLTTGGGGMLLTNDEYIAHKARHLIHQAKLSGNEYIHDEVGYNYRLLNILAAIGVAQVEQLPYFLEKKQEIFQFYANNLCPYQFTTQKINPDIHSNYWLSTFLVPHRTDKQELLNFLHAHKIEARSFWKPMPDLVMFKHFPYISRENIAENIYKNAISLPSGTDITETELNVVRDTIKKYVHQ